MAGKVKLAKPVVKAARLAISADIEEAYVVFDTNVIRAENVEHIGCTGFEAFIEESSEIAKLKLHVPELVVRELCQHLVRSCGRDADRVSKGLKQISSATGKVRRKTLDAEKMRAEIEARVRKYFRDKKVKIPKTPYSVEVLEELEDSAVTSTAPFANYDPNRNNTTGDKGVKDFLILQTVKDLNANIQGRKLVFISSDKRMREGFDNIIGATDKRQCFETLDDYLSEIRLRYEGFTERLSKIVMSKAGSKFFDRKTKQGYYYQWHIRSRIDEEFKEILSRPHLNHLLSDLLDYNFLRVEETRISQPQFVEKSGKLYEFSSEVKKVLVFSPTQSDSEIFARYRFSVKWVALVGGNGRFYSPALLDITFVGMEESNQQSSGKFAMSDFEALSKVFGVPENQ